MLTDEDHFTGREYHSVTELAEMGNRADASRLLLDLVTEKDSGARRAMWESFVKIRLTLPKLNRILNEIRESGHDQFRNMSSVRRLSEVPVPLKDIQSEHKYNLRAQTETLRVNTIMMREKVKIFQLGDLYAELTVISTIRDRRLVERELLARGRHHEEWRGKHLQRELEKIRTDQLFQSCYSQSFWGQMKRLFTRPTAGCTAVAAGAPGIGKTTMVQKVVHDWATGKIYQQFKFVFSFKFRDLNSINCPISLSELILNQYPYFGNSLREVWKNPKRLLFIFDGLDEFKHRISFTDNQGDTDPQHRCPDPTVRCKVSDIVCCLIQHKLLPACSVLVTSRPTAISLLEKANISVWTEILGFVGDKRKEYFDRFFDDQKVAAAVFKHLEDNDILYTMSYNPSYCWILGLTLGPFFTQRVRDSQRIPKTITQLYSYYIYNILKNHGRQIENPRDVLLRVGEMAFAGVSERKIVFTYEDLVKYSLPSSQFLSGFLMELFEREASAWTVVYTFPHLTIQEFAAALAQFLTTEGKDIMHLLTDAHNTADGRFEVFLRFVAGLSSPMSARRLEDFLGPFAHQTTCRVIDWVKEAFEGQVENSKSETDKRRLLNTLHYLFETQNTRLAQITLGSVDALSLRGLRLTLMDCAVLAHVIGHCDTIKHLDLCGCRIQCEGLRRLGPVLHKCQVLGLGYNDLGDSGVQLVSATLRNPDCKIQKLELTIDGVTECSAEYLCSAFSTNRSLIELDLGGNKLGDSGLKALSTALGNSECKVQKLKLHNVGLTEFGAKDIAFFLNINRSLAELDLRGNKLRDSGVKQMCVALSNPECSLQKLWLGWNSLTSLSAEHLASSLSTNCSLTELYLNDNDLGDTGVKLLSAALRNPECKLQKLGLSKVGLTDLCAEEVASALSTNRSLRVLDLRSNSFTDQSVPALRRLILTLPSFQWIRLCDNQFSLEGRNQLKSLWGSRPGLKVDL
ncbi:NACHT, LRR and PYD domains-containing protein 12-like [Hypanus sabinus]|uniref:NACHT, LRR and PYD domains-containing protein 12-like n=1 Tax=Hypanus sabinus TaxID=79690 RepID=UPI0028C38974|nr:NACHT, LRR and PYD domains-containing protein 12-like [Hypanus sabinus]